MFQRLTIRQFGALKQNKRSLLKPTVVHSTISDIPKRAKSHQYELCSGGRVYLFNHWPSVLVIIATSFMPRCDHSFAVAPN